MIRFTRYTKHAQAWLMHADVSVPFKDWVKADPYNESIAAAFFKDPEKFLKDIVIENDASKIMVTK
jgi:hypothetical protein